MIRSGRRCLPATIGVAALLVITACTAPPVEPRPTVTPVPTPTTVHRLVGEWVSADTPSVRLRVDADGSVVGFDGCNTWSGTWKPGGGWVRDEDSLRLEFGMSTEAGCPEGVTPWLGYADAAYLDGSTLRLTGAADGPVGDLQRDD